VSGVGINRTTLYLLTPRHLLAGFLIFWSACMLTSVDCVAYYIAFGAHGPRALPPPGEGWKVAAYTAIGVGVSFLIFATIRSFARAAPDTMTKEYQEATNEYLKVRLTLASLI
jgi:hypothetical protein